MKNISQIKLFISCTSEVKEEINSIKIIIEETNKTSGKQSGFTIESLNWNLDTYTQIGEDAQEVINNQIGPQYDILVAILWQRLGTPTKRDKSGTVEEINWAIGNNKEMLIYFKTAPPDSLNLIDLDQLSKIFLFKKELSGKGVLYKEFSATEDFESLFRININNLITDRLLSHNTEGENRIEKNSKNDDKFMSISGLINEVELKSNDPIENLDIFQLIEELVSYLGKVTSSLNSMTVIFNNLTSKLNEKNVELNRFIGIKDNKLRIDKTRIIVDVLAGELDEFNSRMTVELQSFSENFLLVGPTYSKINSFTSGLDFKEIEDMRQSTLSYKDSIESAVHTSASLLRTVMQWPPMTEKFNKSKRLTVITLKDVTKEMLIGLKLLDEATRINDTLDQPK